jgi:hypothetical protein
LKDVALVSSAIVLFLKNDNVKLLVILLPLGGIYKKQVGCVQPDLKQSTSLK